MLKNTVFRGGSHALGIPQGTNTIGPEHPVNGQTRYNSDTGKLEFWANVTGTPSWNAVAREGNVSIQYTSFTGNNVQQVFGPIKGAYSSTQANLLLVTVGTTLQVPGTNFTCDGSDNITFTSPPSNGAQIVVAEGFGSTISTI